MGTVDEFDEIYEDAKADTHNTNAYATGERRLFRDPDDHLVSGVCAGIANYFNIQPVWVRLIFALSLLFAGSGLLVYIILWIVIPKALTRADRMAMKGEKLNLQGFKNNFEEELSSVRNHLNNLGQEARPFIYKLRDFISDFAHHLALFFNGAGKILIKVIGAVVLLAFFAGAIALVVALVAFLGFGAGHGNGMFPMSIWVNEHADRIYVAAFLTAFIPVLAIILMLISAVFNTTSISRSTGTTILVVWICAVSVLVFYIAKVGSNFRESASFTQTVNLKATPDNVYYLKLDNVKYLTHDDSLRLDVKNNFRNMILTNDFEDDPEPRNISVSIERSDISQPVMIESFTAKGRDYESALLNARDTKYLYTQEDSALKLDDKLRRVPNSSWHAEYLDITIKLPLNSKVIIDQELNDRINLNNVSVNDCKNLNKQYNATSAAFIMTDNGLQCKVDTVVTVKTSAQIDSAHKVNSAKTIAKLQAQIDSTRSADSVAKHK